VLNYGGNQVVHLDTAQQAQFVFSKSPYYYAQHKLSAGQSLMLPPELRSFSVYILECSQDAQLRAKDCELKIAAGDAFQVEASPFELKLEQGQFATILVAGINAAPYPSSCRFQKASDIKLVVKPWGHELWISGEHAGYLFKQIFVRAPHKTSLQYHNQKEETIVVMAGSANLHYKKNAAVKNDDVSPADVTTVRLDAIAMLGATPGVLHRMEALSDLMLYETSTPHHHDVVRVSDDSNRPDGRIAEEHNP